MGSNSAPKCSVCSGVIVGHAHVSSGKQICVWSVQTRPHWAKLSLPLSFPADMLQGQKKKKTFLHFPSFITVFLLKQTVMEKGLASQIIHRRLGSRMLSSSNLDICLWDLREKAQFYIVQLLLSKPCHFWMQKSLKLCYYNLMYNKTRVELLKQSLQPLLWYSDLEELLRQHSKWGKIFVKM